MGVRLWLIMMVLVVFTIGLMWVIQVLIMERNYVNMAVNGIQNRLEPIMEELETDDLAGNDGLLSSLSKAADGKLLLVDGEGRLMAMYSYGLPIDLESDSQEITVWEDIQKSDSYDCILERESYTSEKKKGSRLYSYEIGIPVQYNGEEAYAILYHSFTELYEVLDMNRKQLVAFSVLLSLVSAVLAALLSKSFTKPIHIIKGTVDELAKGDLSAEPDLARKDEIGQLAESVRQLGRALRRVDDLRKEVIANVSHELKTPLQSIIGCAELIENGLVKNGDLEAFAGRIRSQGSRLVRLIEDIILLSRLDELHESMHETVSFNQITKEVFESIAHKAEEHHIELIKEGPDITYYGVYRYLYELIYNLCDNAVKYGKDQGYVKVITEETEKKIIIKVKDNGIGIPIEHQARIFERFYRVDKSHSRRMGGTGLGLSIVKRVVLFHKGKIKLESKEGVGSTFIVCFKKRLAADKTQEQAADTEEQNKE